MLQVLQNDEHGFRSMVEYHGTKFFDLVCSLFVFTFDECATRMKSLCRNCRKEAFYISFGK